MSTDWPEDKRRFVTAAQVAAWLGYPTTRAFYRDRAWRDANGFPPQALKRRWRAGQIEAWEEARLRGLLPLPQPANETRPPAPGRAREALNQIRARLAQKEA